MAKADYERQLHLGNVGFELHRQRSMERTSTTTTTTTTNYLNDPVSGAMAEKVATTGGNTWND